MPTGSRTGALLVPLTVIGTWELLVDLDVISFDFLPAPRAILTALAAEIGSGELPTDLTHTVGVVVLATLLGVTVGGALGIAIGLITPLRTYLAASIDVLRTIPAVALLPIVALAAGPGIRAELLLAGYVAVWPMVLNTASGVEAVPRRLHDVARMLRFSRPATIVKIVLPAVAPAWLVGARLAAIGALHVALIAEMVLSGAGLGGGLTESLHALHPARMWAYALTCGILGYTVNAALRQTLRLVLPGSPANRAAGGVP